MNKNVEILIMRILFCWMVLIGTALAEESKGSTNKVNSAEAKAAMSVIQSDEASEAEEVAETVRLSAESTNEVAAAEEESPSILKKMIELVEPKPEEKKGVEPAEEIDPWEAFMPPPDSEFDWIQLTSGEWLKGDFKVLYNNEVEFDSDEMDLQTFDLEDVKRMRTRGMKTIFIQGEGGRRDTEILRGLLEMNDHEVILRRSEHEVVLSRSRVISIAGGSQKERDNWSGKLSVGANLRGGNTETMDINTAANLRRRTAKTRFNIDYLANYSEVQTSDGMGNKNVEETADNQRLNGYFDLFMTSQLYWQIVYAEYYRDPIVNIKNQYSVNTATGYDFIRNSRTEWTFNIGAGYQQTQFDSVQAGTAEQSDTPFGTLGTRLDHEINGDLDLLFDYSARYLNETSGKYTHHMVTTLSYEIFSDFDLDISLVWGRIESPTPGEVDDGLGGTILVTPEQNDYQLIVGIGYEF